MSDPGHITTHSKAFMKTLKRWMMKKKTVSFLASGRGSNFRVVAERIIDATIPARLGVLISDKSDAPALGLAKNLGMKALHVAPRNFAGREAFDREIIRLLDECGTDLVVAAGYMRILSPLFVEAYRHRIINIHPALLPAFPGIHAQEKAMEYGVKITGCTAHFIDEGTDTGPIILQSAVQVLDSDTADTLADRILKEEHRIFPEAVKLFCENRLKIEGRRVFIKK